MNALPPTNPCCDRPSRLSPITDEIRTGPPIRGMWHDWQLRCSVMNALCCHSW
jgi:hypothetical protein